MTIYTDIDAPELEALLASDETIQLVDVRNDHETLSGVIPGALHIPLSQLPSRLHELNASTPIVFYCHAGIRSIQACNFTASVFNTPLYNLRGGIVAWAKSGLTLAPIK